MPRVEDDTHEARTIGLLNGGRGGNAPAKSTVSVVVPTYNEAATIPVLAARLAAAMDGRAWELVVVDDGSPDGTADIAEGLAPAIPVRVVRRSGKQGLATAVMAGFADHRGGRRSIRRIWTSATLTRKSSAAASPASDGQYMCTFTATFCVLDQSSW